MCSDLSVFLFRCCLSLLRWLAGVILGDCPNRHDSETALLGVLRFGDVPIFAGLLFPRPCVLPGKLGKGFEWTADLYKTLGSGASFHQVEANAESVIAGLP